jgi:hypothetical protein
MQLRHIRPRSVDWYDATLEEEKASAYQLSLEEKTKLRRIGEIEPVHLAPLIHGATLEARGPTRQLL